MIWIYLGEWGVYFVFHRCFLKRCICYFLQVGPRLRNRDLKTPELQEARLQYRNINLFSFILFDQSKSRFQARFRRNRFPFHLFMGQYNNVTLLVRLGIAMTNYSGRVTVKMKGLSRLLVLWCWHFMAGTIQKRKATHITSARKQRRDRGRNGLQRNTPNNLFLQLNLSSYHVPLCNKVTIE